MSAAEDAARVEELACSQVAEVVDASAARHQRQEGMVKMSNTPKRRADAFEKPAKVKSTTAPTPKPKPLKLHTRSPYRGGRASQAPFLREELDRGGGSPVGP